MAQLVGNRADVARLARDLLAGVGRALIDLAPDAIARLAGHVLRLLLRLDMTTGRQAAAAHSALGQTLATTSRPRKRPALLMGLGLGGFIDGIVLHQILQ